MEQQQQHDDNKDNDGIIEVGSLQLSNSDMRENICCDDVKHDEDVIEEPKDLNHHSLLFATEASRFDDPRACTEEVPTPDDGNDVLRSFPLYGWIPDPHLSNDENYMDLVMILTRSSHCRQGSMACLLVKSNPKNHEHHDDDNDEPLPDGQSLFRLLCSAIIGASTNQPLYSEMDSDVHAEIGALGQAARHGRATEGCTAYITMPPCARCFAALTVSGITRIVSRRVSNNASMQAVALQRNIIMVDLASTEAQRQERIQQLIHRAQQQHDGSTNDNQQQSQLQQKEMIANLRKRKKEVKQLRKNAKITSEHDAL